WLEDCKKESVNIPILRESISQYVYLLKKLTNQNTSVRMSEDIINRVLYTSENLSAYKALLNVQKDLKKELIRRILTRLVKMLDKEGFSSVRTSELLIDKGILISFQNPALIQKKLVIELSFRSSKYSNLTLDLCELGANDTVRYIKRLPYTRYRDWHFNDLNKIGRAHV